MSKDSKLIANFVTKAKVDTFALVLYFRGRAYLFALVFSNNSLISLLTKVQFKLKVSGRSKHSSLFHKGVVDYTRWALQNVALWIFTFCAVNSEKGSGWSIKLFTVVINTAIL
jgi:hypothetical protein